MGDMSACGTDVMAFDPVSEEVREAMMVAMNGTLQHAAIECAEICLQRLKVLHDEMLRRFDEAQRQASAQRLAVLKNFDDATFQAQPIDFPPIPPDHDKSPKITAPIFSLSDVSGDSVDDWYGRNCDDQCSLVEVEHHDVGQEVSDCSSTEDVEKTQASHCLAGLPCTSVSSPLELGFPDVDRIDSVDHEGGKCDRKGETEHKDHPAVVFLESEDWCMADISAQVELLKAHVLHSKEDDISNEDTVGDDVGLRHDFRDVVGHAEHSELPSVQDGEVAKDEVEDSDQVSQCAKHDTAKNTASNEVDAPTPMQELAWLRAVLKQAHTGWSSKDLGQVEDKLRVVGVHSPSSLGEVLDSNQLNRRLRRNELRCLSSATLEALRHSVTEWKEDFFSH
jgi:hypothetical protein